MKCYKHNDNHNIDHGHEAPPTDDQKVDCEKDEDVCTKVFWLETNRDPPVIQTKRDCGTKERLKKKGWAGGEKCTKRCEDEKKTCEVGEEYNLCGCTTDYCNKSTFSTPFHFLPLIVLSFVKIFFI